MKINKSTINSLWASFLMEELVRYGVTYACISPGSRSTPLTIAAAEHNRIRTLVHFDERGAAFHAVGYARATGKPAILVCTSGTAVANYLPAVIEAHQTGLPLIILSADRPPELHNIGANQTIKQDRIFDHYSRMQITLPCPDTTLDITLPLETIDRAVTAAISGFAGPVHVNCQFREPLAPLGKEGDYGDYVSPLGSWLESDQPLKKVHSIPNDDPQVPGFDELVDTLDRTEHGILVIGRLNGESERKAVLGLAEHLGWPTFPDITSGLRLGANNDVLIPYYDQILVSDRFAREHRPNTVLHLGGSVVSKRLLEYLESAKPEDYTVISNNPTCYDPVHSVTRHLKSDIAQQCDRLVKRVNSIGDPDWLDRFKIASEAARTSIREVTDSSKELSEPTLARLLSELLPTDTGLFLASSLSVREVDMFGDATGSGVRVAANRGASGIDGTVASAAGFSVGLERPVTMLIGDLAFLHDLNSLALLKSISQPVTIVVVNNNGGNIFSMLPVAQMEPVFEEFFLTPHNLTFENAAGLFGLDHIVVGTADEFVAAYRAATGSGRSGIIEIMIDRKKTVPAHQDIAGLVRSRLGDL